MTQAVPTAPGGHAVRVEDVPDPQVDERATRRTYTAKYKIEIDLVAVGVELPLHGGPQQHRSRAVPGCALQRQHLSRCGRGGRLQHVWSSWTAFSSPSGFLPVLGPPQHAPPQPHPVR
jgi:hypothetical protein